MATSAAAAKAIPTSGYTAAIADRALGQPGTRRLGKSRAGRLAHVVAIGIGAVGAGEWVAAADAPLPGGEIGLVRVQCTSESGYRQVFRGAVIEIDGGPRYDVILTAGHGLPRDLETVKEYCAVIDANGRRHPLRGMWRPEDSGRGMVDDWAVLATYRRMRRSQPRLPVATPFVVEDSDTSLRLPLMTLAEERDCELLNEGLRAREIERGLFSHSCRSWYGHSGSPILAAANGRAVVIGLHLAKRWFYEEHRTVKIGRYVDTEIIDAIDAAAGDNAPSYVRVAWQTQCDVEPSGCASPQ
jgi:hypothetical protein